MLRKMLCEAMMFACALTCTCAYFSVFFNEDEYHVSLQSSEERELRKLFRGQSHKQQAWWVGPLCLQVLVIANLAP